MKDTKLARRTLKNVIDTLSDHHYEITVAATALNANLLKAEERGFTSIFVNAATRNADELVSLLDAQHSRCRRTEAEIRQLRNRIK